MEFSECDEIPHQCNQILQVGKKVRLDQKNIQESDYMLVLKLRV